MKRIILLILAFASTRLSAQDADGIIHAAEVGNIEKTLSSDDMRGREPGTAGIEKAASFIETEFRKAGLQTLDGGNSYRQTFTIVRTKSISLTAVFDGQPVSPEKIAVASPLPEVKVDDKSGYEIVHIRQGDVFHLQATKYLAGTKNCLVLVDTSFARYFSRDVEWVKMQRKLARTVVFVLAAQDPSRFSVHLQQEVKEIRESNIVGILPGTDRKEELVLFSGHYDHLGVQAPDSRGDSIYNGANDDASGVTAVITLANYFAKTGKHKRTLIFAAFTLEEVGFLGSDYFATQMKPSAIAAMFNFELIGTESRWGKNSMYLTGYDRTDMGKILFKNLAGSPYTLYPDPYPQATLFYRSDNLSLARRGVPAHTFSSYYPEVDKTYHTPEDEVGNLDIDNMTNIIKAVALSARSIVDGKDTPSRLDPSKL